VSFSCQISTTLLRCETALNPKLQTPNRQGGAVSGCRFTDRREQGSRSAFEEKLLGECGYKAIFQAVKSAKDLSKALSEASFRMSRVQVRFGVLGVGFGVWKGGLVPHVARVKDLI
jgi:hypothetical protein